MARAWMAIVLLACSKTEAPPPPPPPVVETATSAPAPVFVTASHVDNWDTPFDPKEVPRDLKKALAFHEKRCRDHQWSSCLEVVRFAHEGIGAPRDVTKAKGYLRTACAGGSKGACHWMLTFEPESPTQLEIDHVLGHYQLSCQNYHGRDECSLLGDIYRFGEFVRADLRRAATFYERACEWDEPVGCNNLGAMRALGEGGGRNPTEAKALFTKACSHGSREGCINAGIDPAHPPEPIPD